MFQEVYKRISVSLFGDLADKYSDYFRSLKTHLLSSNINIMVRTWACMIFMGVTLSFLGSILAVALLRVFIPFPLVIFAYMLIFIPVVAASLTFLAFYYYPIQKSKSIEKETEIDLPFALAHMSAIASSGVPVEYIFQLLTDFKEYKAISKQARLIVRNIDKFGMSSIKAINLVARRTPSAQFRQMLNGMASTIEKGGNLSGYLKEMSEKALFNYKLKREEYLKTLSMYADIYTALLVAAPLMMLAVLAILNIIGGQIMGLSIQDMVNIVTFVALPALNVGFLIFIDVTHPGV